MRRKESSTSFNVHDLLQVVSPQVILGLHNEERRVKSARVSGEGELWICRIGGSVIGRRYLGTYWLLSARGGLQRRCPMVVFYQTSIESQPRTPYPFLSLDWPICHTLTRSPSFASVAHLNLGLSGSMAWDRDEMKDPIPCLNKSWFTLLGACFEVSSSDFMTC